MNILLAEDDSISRDLMRRIIALEPGHRLVQAQDGEEAWEILRTAAEPFDVGLFDVTMPRLDGLGLLERVRAQPSLCALPVILCTAINDRRTVERACLLSVSHYIVKPYTKALILEKLHLVAADLAAHSVAEDPVKVAQRLGVDPAALAHLEAALVTEIRHWLDRARQTRLPGAFRELAVGANGLKGAALSLGLRALSTELNRVEATFLHQFGSEVGEQFPPSSAEILGALSAVEAQLGLIAAHARTAA